MYVVIDDYDLVAAPNGINPLAPLLEYLPHAKGSRSACRGGAAVRRRGERDVRPGAGPAARPRMYGLDDERQPRRGRPAGYRSAVATATWPRNACHPVTAAAARADRLDRSGVKDTVVEVGPVAVRGQSRAEQHVESTALQFIDDEIAMLDEQPVAVTAVWRQVFSAVLPERVETAVLVCPTWWPSPRIARVREAAATRSTNVVVVQRADVLVVERPRHSGGGRDRTGVRGDLAIRRRGRSRAAARRRR